MRQPQESSQHGPRVYYTDPETGDNICISYATIVSNDEVEYGVDGHTQVGVTTTYNISGFLFVDPLYTANPQYADIDKLMRYARYQLNRPRQIFSIRSGILTDTVDSEENIDAAFPYVGSNSNDPNYVRPPTLSIENVNWTDFDYGPKPISLNMSKISDYSVAVEWSIKTQRKICFLGDSDSSYPENPYTQISNEQRFSINQAGQTIRTINGVATLNPTRIPASNPILSIDIYRKKIIPKQIPNWERTSIDVQISEDRKTMSYSVIDSERHEPVPTAISNMQADFSVAVEGYKFNVPTLSLSGYMEGPRTTSKGALISYLNDLVVIKFGKAAALTATVYGTGFVWAERVISEDVMNNRIVFKLSGQLYDTTGLTPGLTNFNRMPTEWRKSKGYVVPPFGTADKQADEYIIHSACRKEDADKNPRSASDNNGDTESGAIDTPSNRAGTTIDDSSQLASVQKNNPIINYTEVISYETNTNVKVFSTMSPNSRDVVQKTGHDETYAIQSGTISRLRSQPELPKSVIKGELMKKDITPSAPLLTSNGTIYTTNYRYVTKIANAGNKSKIEQIAMYPNDPRTRDNQVALNVDNLPDYA